VCLGLLLGVGAATSRAASAADFEKFDHFSTGFPLVGAHRSLACESCHINGAFAGTPTRCASCHNGLLAVGKGPNHIVTSAPCEACHNARSAAFRVSGTFDHAGITDGCVRCHNGQSATGRGARHIASSDRCEACHDSTMRWSPVRRVDHAQVIGTCSSCHNGGTAEGKSSNHVVTTAECNVCHKRTTAWLPVLSFDHQGITTGCRSCHNGSRATGQAPSHIPTPTQLECDACHRIPPDSFANAASFSHTLVRTMRCDACHSGGLTSSVAPGKSADHPPTPAGVDCGACHSTTSTFAATTAFDHTGIDAGCGACHDGNRATGKGTAHLPTPSGIDCNACHRVAPDTFASAALFEHGQVLSMRCDACHSGSFTASGAVGKSAAHVVTAPGEDCQACHASTSAFAGAIFDHRTVTGNCFSCHNGIDATGKSASHVPTLSGIDCNECHRVAPDSFANAALFDHNEVVAMRCDVCHNGAYVASGASGKSPLHVAVPAGQDCNACHTSTFTFAGAAVDHRFVTGACSLCHNGVQATGKGAAHLPTPPGADCDTCHRVAPDSFANAALFSHRAVSTMRCEACHSGAYVGAGALGKDANHVSTPPGQDCNVCHLSTATFAGATFNHAGITGSCATCHNGLQASGKTPSHVPTPVGVDCGACHRVAPDTFANAALFNHSQVTGMRCDVCHSGAYASAGALGKSAGHIATAAGQDCNGCHLSTSTFAGASFNHSGITSGCSVCHNGAQATGKTPSHVPTPAGVDCGACHRVAPDTFANAALFNHSQVTGMRCDVCHSGAYVAAGAQGKSAGHIATAAGQDCSACHLSTTTFAGAAFDHTGLTSGCSACHNGTTATGKAASHLPTPAGLDCNGCHRVPPDSFTAAALFSHNVVTSMRCDTCHNGQYRSAGAQGKPNDHPTVSAGQDCNACHNTRDW
jgi:hypothetical protein